MTDVAALQFDLTPPSDRELRELAALCRRCPGRASCALATTSRTRRSESSECRTST